MTIDLLPLHSGFMACLRRLVQHTVQKGEGLGLENGGLGGFSQREWTQKKVYYQDHLQVQRVQGGTVPLA